uniref:Uncharacterized protein n=1 Tax=uncultured marine group II/III euryarchaeote AD1000_26_F05 TaxID=1457744 RepID=A0A075FMP3_9EURY|nr:hypothetical protein [uncultured marine group II/III euryarchaeote AD1000_26_F05]
MAVAGRRLTGRVAQLGSALPWHGRGPEFKSRHVHQSEIVVSAFNRITCFSRLLFFFFSCQSKISSCNSCYGFIRPINRITVILRLNFPNFRARKSESITFTNNSNQQKDNQNRVVLYTNLSVEPKDGL